MKTDTKSAPTGENHDSLFLGLILCWLLNMVQLGIAYLMFVSGERMLPAVFVLVGAIGLVQMGYIGPIWYLARRRGKRKMASGLAIAAGITLLFNASFLLIVYVNGT